ncbi:hypothetical protein Tco_0090609 [Tanacetum coccineum]
MAEQDIPHPNNHCNEMIPIIQEKERQQQTRETSAPPAPKTAKQLAARRNQERVKSILLLAIPDEYLLKFHNVADAKSLWEAIKSRFDGRWLCDYQSNEVHYKWTGRIWTSKKTTVSLDKSRFVLQLSKKVGLFETRDVDLDESREEEFISSDEEFTLANDRSPKAEGYKVVPPPIIVNFLTPRADISFVGLDEYAIRNKIIESQTSELNTKTKIRVNIED